MIVCKFGGTSVARKEALENIKQVSRDKRRKIFVFSAVGKASDFDTKLTDLLINFCEENNCVKKEKIINKIKNKIYSLCVNTEQKIIFNNFSNILYKKKNKFFLISRGEYFTAKIMAKYLGLKYVPAEKIIVFENGIFSEELTKKKLSKIKGRFCTGGFYGFDRITKKIVLFDRGGGDTTGAILAKLSSSEIYENYTDVCGVMDKNPKDNQEAKTIEKLTYSQMKKMCDAGANVLHKSVCDILENTGITTCVKNVFDLEGKYTVIV